MEILSVSLKNFKSHSDRQFVFQPGTNAICGENGAGKTSILEAIAWTLFNYRGNYKIEDLIRNGANSAQVTVAFVSNRDQRTYEVNRCTRSGYTVYDPQLGQKLDYSRIEDEVLPWLRQHLGVAPGTDLADLFGNTIGVPQGLFTADFLKAEGERKKVFDSILKVEEYRRTHDSFRTLVKHSESLVNELQRDLDRYTTDLQEWEPLLARQAQQQTEITQAETDLQRLQAEVQQLQLDRDRLARQAQQLDEYRSQALAVEQQIQAQQRTLTTLEQTLNQADNAAAICLANRDAFQAYEQADQRLQTLQQSLQEERLLQNQKQYLEKQLRDRETQLAGLTHQLQALATAQATIATLEPLAAQQEILEQQQQQVNQQLQACITTRKTLAGQEQQLSQAQTLLAQLRQDIDRTQQLKSAIAEIPALEQAQQRYQQQLSRIAAAIEFEADLRQLVETAQRQGDHYRSQTQTAEAKLQELQQAMPLWTAAIATAREALQTGATWQTTVTASLQTILADLGEQTSASQIERRLRQVEAKLQAARQQQVEFAQLPTLQERYQEQQHIYQTLQAQLQDLTAQLQAEPELQAQQAQIVAQLESLNDPKGQIRLLTQQQAQCPQLENQIAQQMAELDEVRSQVRALEQQLLPLATLPDDLQAQQAVKDSHRVAYEEYLAYRELANTRKERRLQLQAAQAQAQDLQAQATAILEQRDRLAASFNLDEFQTLQTTYQTASHQQVALAARLPEMQKYLAELLAQREKLEAIQAQYAQTEQELERKRRLHRFIKFARGAYKDAGPRITERYVQTIVREADRLFRELLNRPNVSLDWTRNYEIVVREEAHSRRFINLSGGEQMCAALAVRLALLKVLADVDIAFFDEPTTNMDKSRRASLAEAIANIKTFRQLFVISHDDTFEQVTENVIVVDRQ